MLNNWTYLSTVCIEPYDEMCERMISGGIQIDRSRQRLLEDRAAGDYPKCGTDACLLTLIMNNQVEVSHASQLT